MGVIARQSIKGAMANYLGVAIGFLTTFFVITRYLTPEEVGLTRVMVDAAMLFSSLAQLGTNATIVRFFPYFKDEGDPKGRNHGIFGLSVLIPFIGFLLFVIAFVLFHDSISATYAAKSPLMVDYIYYLLPLTFFALYMTVFETNASVLLRITIPKLVREVGVRVFNLICYLLYGFGVITLDWFVALFCGSYLLAMILNIVYLFTLKKISFRIDWSFVDRKMLGEMLRYTLFMTATVLASNIPLFASLFLGAQVGLTLTGVYTIAFFIANVVETPYRSLGAISRPMIAQSVRDNNWVEVNRLGKQVSLHQFLVSTLILFFIWVNLNDLFAIIPNGHQYEEGLWVVLILGIAKVINSSLSIATDVVNYSRHYPMSLCLIVVLTLSAIVLNRTLIDIWGINGAACATLFSYLLYYVLLNVFIYCRLKVNLFSVGLLKTVVLLAVLYTLYWVCELAIVAVVGSSDTIVSVLMRGAVRTLVLGVAAICLLYKMGISKDVNGIINKYIDKFCNFAKRK